MNWQRNRILRQVRARPRLFIATAVATLVGIVLPIDVASHTVTRLLIAWNVGTCLYVLLAAVMMTRSSLNHMRHRAQLQDDGQFVIIILVTISSVASLVAIAAELAVVKDMHGLIKIAHISLAGLTVLSSWAFIQVMFALHYAHDYYATFAKAGRLDCSFPMMSSPDTAIFSTSLPSLAHRVRRLTCRLPLNPCAASVRFIASCLTCSTRRFWRC
jgi:uncharacterized membrane protein